MYEKLEQLLETNRVAIRYIGFDFKSNNKIIAQGEFVNGDLKKIDYSIDPKYNDYKLESNTTEIKVKYDLVFVDNGKNIDEKLEKELIDADLYQYVKNRIINNFKELREYLQENEGDDKILALISDIIIYK